MLYNTHSNVPEGWRDFEVRTDGLKNDKHYVRKKDQWRQVAISIDLLSINSCTCCMIARNRCRGKAAKFAITVLALSLSALWPFYQGMQAFSS